MRGLQFLDCAVHVAGFLDAANIGSVVFLNVEGMGDHRIEFATIEPPALPKRVKDAVNMLARLLKFRVWE